MKKCIHVNNLLTNISRYLTHKEIIILSHSNKSLRDSLNPNKNSIINNIFFQSLIEKYFEFDEDIIKNNKKNLLDKFMNSKKNYKEFMKELDRNFNRYNNENIRKKVIDCLRIHMYLPDLRKENYHLEKESSDIHLMVSYDMLFRTACTSNYYSKFITKQYMLNESNKNEKDNQIGKGKEIRILKEGLYFEEELKNFRNTFCEFVNNEKYKEIIFNVVEYNYNEIDYKYKNLYSNTDSSIKYTSINSIIYLLLWITHIFILYSDFAYYYMCDFKDDTDEKTILNEYVHKHNEIINCALLLNSNFENVNIIINNYINFFQLKDLICKKSNVPETSSDNSTSTNSSKTIFNTTEKFSLYKFFFNIIKENLYQRLSNTLLINKFKKLIKNFCKELFEETKIDEKNNTQKENDVFESEEEENKKSENMIIEEDYSDEDEIMDELMEERETSQKEAIENFMNCQVDYMINEKNANAINHSELKVPSSYQSIENLFCNIFVESIEYYIKEEKPVSELFQIVEKITNCNSKTKSIFRSSESLDLIRRTKKILMQKCLQVLIRKGIDDYIKSFDTHIKTNEKNEFELSLGDNEITNNNEYKCDLLDLSQKTRIKITELVEKEIDQLNEILKEKCEKLVLSEYKKEQKKKLVDEFSKCDGVPEVLLLKKMVWFYYKQLGIYEEKNDKIISILKCKNMCQEENDNQLYEDKCLINENQNFQLMKEISKYSS